MCAFILTRIDYCNAVLANLPDSRRRVLHAAAQFVVAIGPRDHVTPTLISLHWLPVRQRITYSAVVAASRVFWSSTGFIFLAVLLPFNILNLCQLYWFYPAAST